MYNVITIDIGTTLKQLEHYSTNTWRKNNAHYPQEMYDYIMCSTSVQNNIYIYYVLSKQLMYIYSMKLQAVDKLKSLCIKITL